MTRKQRHFARQQKYYDTINEAKLLNVTFEEMTRILREREEERINEELRRENAPEMRNQERLKRMMQESLMEFDESGIARVKISIPNAPVEWDELWFGTFSSRGSSSIAIRSNRAKRFLILPPESKEVYTYKFNYNEPDIKLVSIEVPKRKLSWSNYLGRRCAVPNENIPEELIRTKIIPTVSTQELEKRETWFPKFQYCITPEHTLEANLSDD